MLYIYIKSFNKRGTCSCAPLDPPLNMGKLTGTWYSDGNVQKPIKDESGLCCIGIYTSNA